MFEVFPKVLTAALARMDAGSLEIRQCYGKARNAAWCQINGKSFFFTYDHLTDTVRIKEGTMQGRPLATFGPTNSFEEISRTLASL